MRTLTVEHNRSKYVGNEKPEEPHEVAITVVAAAIILLAFIVVALMT